MTPGKAKGTRCDRDLSAYQTSCTEAVFSGLNELNNFTNNVKWFIWVLIA